MNEGQPAERLRAYLDGRHSVIACHAAHALPLPKGPIRVVVQAERVHGLVRVLSEVGGRGSHAAVLAVEDAGVVFREVRLLEEELMLLVEELVPQRRPCSRQSLMPMLSIEILDFTEQLAYLCAVHCTGATKSTTQL